MANKILIVYLISITLFLFTGGLLIAFPLLTDAAINKPPTLDTVARNFVLDRLPLSASTINAIIVFATTLLTVPALILPTTRAWVKLQGYLITISALLSLILGLLIWYDTLRTRSNLSSVYASQESARQSLLQQKFNCCGYTSAASPAFVKDRTCTGAIQAAMMQPCVGPLSRYVNNFEDIIFTAMFGIVGIDVLAVLAVTMVLKDRGDREMYRFLDAKTGMGGF